MPDKVVFAVSLPMGALLVVILSAIYGADNYIGGLVWLLITLAFAFGVVWGVPASEWNQDEVEESTGANGHTDSEVGV